MEVTERPNSSELSSMPVKLPSESDIFWWEMTEPGWAFECANIPNAPSITNAGKNNTKIFLSNNLQLFLMEAIADCQMISEGGGG